MARMMSDAAQAEVAYLMLAAARTQIVSLADRLAPRVGAGPGPGHAELSVALEMLRATIDRVETAGGQIIAAERESA